MPEGLSAYVVENQQHAADAMQKLRASMQVRATSRLPAPACLPALVCNHMCVWW